MNMTRRKRNICFIGLIMAVFQLMTIFYSQVFTPDVISANTNVEPAVSTVDSVPVNSKASDSSISQSDLISVNSDSESSNSSKGAKSSKSSKSSESSKPKPSGKKICYLTFDDGPSENTLTILETLKEYDVKATFFVIGKSKTDYIKNIVEEGHAIGLHSYSHDYKKIYCDEESFYKDLKKLEDIVLEKAGIESKIIRFPGGTSNTVGASGVMAKLAKSVVEKGYMYFDWNCDGRDSVTKNITAQQIVNNVKKSASLSGEVTVLLHDSASRRTTAQAVPGIIKYFKDEGYVFDVLSKDVIPVQQKPSTK